jgi:hypothetical protein
VPVNQVEPVLSLYRERYAGFTAQHFHDKLCQHHGFRLGYTWTKLRLQAAGLLAKAPRRAPQEAPAPAAARHAAASGRLAAPSTSTRMARSPRAASPAGGLDQVQPRAA